MTEKYWKPGHELVAEVVAKDMIWNMEQETTSNANVLARISTPVKRHHDHSNTYKGKHLTDVVAHNYRVTIIILVGHGYTQADMTLQR